MKLNFFSCYTAATEPFATCKFVKHKKVIRNCQVGQIKDLPHHSWFHSYAKIKAEESELKPTINILYCDTSRGVTLNCSKLNYKVSSDQISIMFHLEHFPFTVRINENINPLEKC